MFVLGLKLIGDRFHVDAGFELREYTYERHRDNR